MDCMFFLLNLRIIFRFNVNVNVRILDIGIRVVYKRTSLILAVAVDKVIVIGS